MTELDLKDFAELWIATWESSGNNRVPSDRVVSLAFQDLSIYAFEQIEYALAMHRRSSKFPPTVADVIEIINQYWGYKHIGPEEAWVIALESFDERNTVVWTAEIAQAKTIADPLFAEGDKIAARMAFKDAYSRIIQTTQAPPAWTVCQGSDAAQKELTLKKAVQCGRISEKSAHRFLLDSTKFDVDVALNAHILLETESKPEAVKLLGSPAVGFLELADMAASKNSESSVNAGIRSLKAVFVDIERSAFDVEIAIMRKSGNDKADEFIALAKKSPDMLEFFTKRAEEENKRFEEEQRKKRMLKDARSRLPEEQRDEFDQAMRGSRDYVLEVA